MKCSAAWLREWVNPDLSLKELCQRLTMAGFEVESIDPVADHFTDVVVGEITSINKHPDANNLQICQVRIDPTQDKLLQIVCGAENVREGLKVAVAKVNAHLPHQVLIQHTLVRGVESNGMLCSAKELGLSEKSEGILILSSDAPIGVQLWEYLALNDVVIDISITPNRGDCLSILGIAREVSAVTQSPLIHHPLSATQVATEAHLTVDLKATHACPHYLGRIIKNVRASSITPTWLSERLRRAGIRCINPIVDVANYVMLEMGQPLHAFDLAKLVQRIDVRFATPGERLLLLDGNEKILDDQTLIIADQQTPLAIAGIMGGLESGVTSLTTDIFLESAYFDAAIIARSRQHYGVVSDAAYRYERGVDPTLQREAIERATQLIIEIVGGEPGPIIEARDDKNLPVARSIFLSQIKLNRLLGISIPIQRVSKIFDALNFKYQQTSDGWHVTVPSYRFDLSLPEDLVEEIARIYGYDRIPSTTLLAASFTNKAIENDPDYTPIRTILANQGYHEIISYSFVSEAILKKCDPGKKILSLVNPVSADMAVMRTNLIPGLIKAFQYNRSRQQQRIRLFEIGTCFNTVDGTLKQAPFLAGLIAGPVQSEQWVTPSRAADFYDIKGDIESLLLKICGPSTNLEYSRIEHAAFHPGQNAGIFINEREVGKFGALHPQLAQELEVNDALFIFEIDLLQIPQIYLENIKSISKFPEIRRDIALIVNEAIPAKAIQDTIKQDAGDWLVENFVFDVYQGQGVAPGAKSIALALIFQHPTRTLIEEEITTLMDRVICGLRDKFGAELRS